MHLSRTPSPPQFSARLDEFSPVPATRLVPLTTKYFSPKSRAELPGWRESIGGINSPLEIATQRPYVVKSKGQWTSQPRYPHYKHSRNASMPTLPKPKSRSALLKYPLSPTVNEMPLAARQDADEEEVKMYLPPLRHVDNKASHHDHPGTALSELRLTADSDLFTQIQPKVRPKPPKPPQYHRPTPRPLISGTVRFRPPVHITVSVETDRPPCQEQHCFSRLKKPLDIPERYLRRVKEHRKPTEEGSPMDCREAEEDVGSGIILTGDDIFESGESVLFRYSEESEEVGQFDTRTRGSYISSDAVTSAGQSPKRERIEGERRRYKEVMKKHSRTQSQKQLTFPSIQIEERPPSEEVRRGTEGTPGLPSTDRKLKTTKSDQVGSVSPVSDLLPNSPTPVLTGLLYSVTSDLHTFDDPHNGRFSTTEDMCERTDDPEGLLDTDLKLGLSPRKESFAGMSTLSTLQDAKIGKQTTDDPGSDLETPIEEENAVETIIEEVEEATDGVFTSPVLTKSSSREKPTSGQQSLSLPETRPPKGVKSTPPVYILPAASPRTDSSSSPDPPPSSADTPRMDGEPRVTEIPSDFSLANHVIVEEQSDKDSSDYSVSKVSSAQVSSARHSPRGSSFTPTPVPSELTTKRKDSSEEKTKAEGMMKLSPPRRSISDVASLRRQLSRLSEKEEIQASAKAPKVNSGKRKALSKTPKRKPPTAKPPPKLKLSTPTIETLPGLVVEAPQLYSNSASPQGKEKDSPASPTKVMNTSKVSSIGGVQSRRGSLAVSSRRQSTLSNKQTGREEKSDAQQHKPPDVFTFKDVEFVSADEVFVRQFSFALMRVILGLDTPQTDDISDLSSLKQQLESVRRKVLKVGYKPVGSAQNGKKASVTNSGGIPSFKSEVDSQATTPAAVKAAAFRMRAGSIMIPAVAPKGKPRASFLIKPSVLAAVHKLPAKDSDESEESEEEDDSESEHCEPRNMYRVSQSLTEFELKHSSLLKNLAFNLAAREQDPPPPVAPPVVETPEDSEDDDVKPKGAVTDVWFTGHAEDLADDVHQSLFTLFHDFKESHINAFTSSVTSFFKDPQATKTIDVNEATEKEEMDVDNYKESVERRKFLEYMRMLPDYQALHQTQPGVLQQTNQERPHPRELRDLFRLTFLKRKLRAHIAASRNGTSPATLRAKPSFTFSGLDTKYHARRTHRPQLSEPCFEDVILSGGAHTVTSEMLYRERVYCRMKQEPNLSKFALKPKTRRLPHSSHTTVNSPN